MADISKEVREYNVFKRFANVCTYYSIALSTIEVGDNPDVKCKLSNGIEKWFELTEIIDPDYLKIKKARIKFEKILHNYMFEDQLFILAFKDKKVTIGFSRSFTSTILLKKDLPKLLHYLHDLNAQSIKEIGINNKFDFIDYIAIQDSKFGPKIRVPNTQSVGIPIEERLKDKFMKSYAKNCDLLLYYDKLTVFDRAAPYSNIEDYLKTKTNNPFSKIWIFSLKDDSIVFEYP